MNEKKLYKYHPTAPSLPGKDATLLCTATKTSLRASSPKDPINHPH